MEKQRPLSKREHLVWRAVKSIGETGLARVATTLERSTGLSGPDFAILSRLEDLGHGKLSQKALNESLRWGKSRLSHHLTRMEQRGLLKREETPGSRIVTLKILVAGKNAISLARPVHAKAVREHILEYIDPGEADALIRVMERLQTAA